MKVALAHDYLNQWGGAEKVLGVFAEIFPDAPIYTLLYDEASTLCRFKNRKIITSYIDLPIVRRNHRPFIPIMPFAARFLNIASEFDMVISSSASFAKGIAYEKHIKHLAYIHTPLRYAWEQDAYLRPITRKAQLKIYRPILNWLKMWDYKAAQRPNLLLANSEFIANKIKNYYARNAITIYPPVDLHLFSPGTVKNNDTKSEDYFLAIGRFLHYKKFDLVIETFKELGLKILIVGQGPEEEKIKKLAMDAPKNNIRVTPFVKTDAEVRNLYRNARAVIFPQVEDFGLVAAESVACGTPVIAYDAGGAREIINSKSGILFKEQTKESLSGAVYEFIRKENCFRPKTVSRQAQKFSKTLFVDKIKEIIENYF